MSRTSTWSHAPTDTLRLPKVFKAEIERLARALDCGNGAEAVAVFNELLEQYKTVEPVVEEPQETVFVAPLPVRFISRTSLEDCLLEDDDFIPEAVLAQVFQPEFTNVLLAVLDTAAQAPESETTAVVAEASLETVAMPDTTATAPLTEPKNAASGIPTTGAEETQTVAPEVPLEANAAMVEGAVIEPLEWEMSAVTEPLIETALDVQEAITEDFWLTPLPHSVTEFISDVCARNGSYKGNYQNYQLALPEATLREAVEPPTEAVEGVVAAPVAPEIILLQNTVEPPFEASPDHTNNATEEAEPKSDAPTESEVIPLSVTELQASPAPELHSVTETETEANSPSLTDKTALPFDTFEPAELTVTALPTPLNLPVAVQTITPLDLKGGDADSAVKNLVRKLRSVAAQERKVPPVTVSPSVTETVSRSVTELTAPFSDTDIDVDLEVTETVKESKSESLLTPVEVERLTEFSRVLFQTWYSLSSQKPRADQSQCWGVNVSIEAVYRRGFQSISMHRFLYLLEQLAKVETVSVHGHLCLSQKGSQNPVTLNKVLVNKITYYDPQSELDPEASSRVDPTLLTQTNDLSGEFEGARKAIAVHVDKVTHNGSDSNREDRHKQEHEQTTGRFGLLQKLRRFLG